MPKVTTHRRLFALSGIVPLGAFVAVHLVTTATGIGGAARFDRTFSHRAWVTAAIIAFVLLPLAFHATYGVWMAIGRAGSPALPTWHPRLRRTAALATLAFVAAHVIELPGRVWTGSIAQGALFDVVAAHLSSTWHGVPFVALFYLAGVAGTLAHFALELWIFFPGAGLVLGDGARRALAWGIIGGAGVLFLVAGNTIVYFATGLRLFGPSAPAFVPEGPPRPDCSPNGQMHPRE